MDATGLAETILIVHVGIIAFNVAGLFVIPLGAWLGWRIVRVGWLRLLHLALWGAVAGQALAGRACILTVWQSRLLGSLPTPLVMHWIDRLIYWNLPLWFFAVLYIALFFYIIALCWLVPFGPREREPSRSRPAAAPAPSGSRAAPPQRWQKPPERVYRRFLTRRPKAAAGKESET